MNRKILIVLLIPFMLTQCSYYYRIFKKESKFFTEQEKVILAQTTRAIDFNYSFDPDIKLDCIFANTDGGKIEKKKEDAFKKVLESFKKEEVTSFFETIYRLKLTIEYTMKEAKEDKEWNDYTYISKYIVPGFTIYYNMLEKHVFQVVPEYKETFVKKKKEIEVRIAKEFD